MMRFDKMLTFSAAIALAAACGESGTAPQPSPPPSPPPPAPVSSAKVSLVTPNTTDGAVLITLNGPDVSAIEPADSHYVVYKRSVNSSETRLIIIGNLVAGPLFTAQLSTPHLVSDYAGSIQQVATRTDSIRASTSGYQLTVTTPPTPPTPPTP